MTAEVLPHFKKDISEFILVPSDGGRFEIFVDEEPVYSKLETGQFPRNRDIVAAIDRKLHS